MASPYVDRASGRLAALSGEPRAEGETECWYEGWDVTTLDLERMDTPWASMTDSWPGWY